MACKTCGLAGSSCGCDTSCFGGTANWLVPVKVVPPIEMASRKFAYITPDDIVWVVNHDGTEVIPLSDDIDWIIDADKALPSLEDADPLRIYRQDNKMYIINETKTDWIDLTESIPEQVQSDWDITDEDSKAFIKNKPTIPTPVDFEKSKLVTETTITATNPGATLTPTAMKTELIVNSLETELRSGTIYIHDLTANIGAQGVGNNIDFKIIVPVPSGMTIASDRLPLMAVSDTGGLTYATGMFADFKTEIDTISIDDSGITIIGGFYASANYPSNVHTFNFRDVIVKFL